MNDRGMMVVTREMHVLGRHQDAATDGKERHKHRHAGEADR